MSPPGEVVSSVTELSVGEPSATGASLTAVMVTVELTTSESLSPSLTIQEIVRLVVSGLSELLL